MFSLVILGLIGFVVLIIPVVVDAVVTAVVGKVVLGFILFLTVPELCFSLCNLV